jgi:hypothetical protein
MKKTEGHRDQKPAPSVATWVPASACTTGGRGGGTGPARPGFWTEKLFHRETKKEEGNFFCKMTGAPFVPFSCPSLLSRRCTSSLTFLFVFFVLFTVPHHLLLRLVF